MKDTATDLRPKTPPPPKSSGLLLLALAIATAAFLSFTVYSPDQREGELYSACVALRDSLEENPVIATLLGLGDANEA
jgi:hypothetical protein